MMVRGKGREGIPRERGNWRLIPKDKQDLPGVGKMGQNTTSRVRI